MSKSETAISEGVRDHITTRLPESSKLALQSQVLLSQANVSISVTIFLPTLGTVRLFHVRFKFNIFMFIGYLEIKENIALQGICYFKESY